MIAPLIMPPNMKPKIVNIGIAAFGRAWFTIKLLRRTFLDSAANMYLLPSTSSMDERVKRAKTAA